MSVYGSNQFGGVGSGAHFVNWYSAEPSGWIADVCNGCFVFEAILPDCDYAAIDPLGDERKLRVLAGENIFLPTPDAGERSEPFVKADGSPDEQGSLFEPNRLWLVDGPKYNACTYVVGAEIIGDQLRATPAAAVRLAYGSLNGLTGSPGAPAPQPFVFQTASEEAGAAQVRLTLGIDVMASGDWIVTASGKAFGETRPVPSGSLFTISYSPSYDNSTPCDECGFSFEILPERDFWSLPLYTPGGWSDRTAITLPSVRGLLDIETGCNLFNALVSRQAVATPPADWGKVGAVTGDASAQNIPGGFLGHGISFRKELTTPQSAETTYSYFVDVCAAETAEIGGAVGSSLKWSVPNVVNLFHKTQGQSPADFFQGGGHFASVLSEGVHLFCSPWSGRGVATALGTTVTFSHFLEVNEDTTADSFFGGFGLTEPIQMPPPFESITWSAPALLPNVGFRVDITPRVLESTAPPHLPARAQDVVDIEQCIFLSWQGVSMHRQFRSGNFFGTRSYVAPPCLTQQIFEAAKEEPYLQASFRGPAPEVPQFDQRIRAYSSLSRGGKQISCVRFTGQHKNFTLPMFDGNDMESLIVSVDIANAALASKAINSPLARSTLFTTNPPAFFNENLEFSPDSYISTKSLAGAFSLGNQRQDGTWLGQNTFFYVGPGAQQSHQIRASALDFPTPNDPVAAASDGAISFITPAECVPAASPCDQFADIPSDECLEWLGVIGVPFVYFTTVPLALDFLYQNDSWVPLTFDESKRMAATRYDRTSFVDPRFSFAVVGTDWTFRQNNAALRCTVTADDSVNPSYLSAETIARLNSWQFANSMVAFRPLPRFNISLVSLCETWCHSISIDRREVRRATLPIPYFDDQFDRTLWTSPPLYAGERMSSATESVDMARATYTVTQSFSLACNDQEAEAFYARQPVTLYARIGSWNPGFGPDGTYGQQLRGNDLNLYPAIAFTFQSG